MAEVYTLVVEVGRKPGRRAAEGRHRGDAALLRGGGRRGGGGAGDGGGAERAELAPLDVTGYGTLAEREAEGEEVDADERELISRAGSENAVIVAEVTPVFDDADALGATSRRADRPDCRIVVAAAFALPRG